MGAKKEVQKAYMQTWDGSPEAYALKHCWELILSTVMCLIENSELLNVPSSCKKTHVSLGSKARAFILMCFREYHIEKRMCRVYLGTSTYSGLGDHHFWWFLVFKDWIYITEHMVCALLLNYISHSTNWPFESHLIRLIWQWLCSGERKGSKELALYVAGVAVTVAQISNAIYCPLSTARGQFLRQK